MRESESCSGFEGQRARFARVDTSEPSDWHIIRREVDRRQAELPDRILGLLRSLSEVHDGFPVDQLTHALQTAARAERDGATDELIVTALCHDIGKVVSSYDHPMVSAAVLRPHVSAEVIWVIENHQLILGRHYAGYFELDPEAWHSIENHPSFDLAWKFVEAWDQCAFDASYPTPSLDHYEPLVRTWFGRRNKR